MFIQAQNPDLLLITESRIHQDILDSEENIPGYQMIRRDRHEFNGGGCLLYSKSNIHTIDQSELNEDLCSYIQIIWPKIRTPHDEFL